MRGVAVTRVAVRTLFMCAPPPQPARPHLATAGLLVSAARGARGPGAARAARRARPPPHTKGASKKKHRFSARRHKRRVIIINMIKQYTNTV